MSKKKLLFKPSILVIALTVCAFSLSMPTICFNIAMTLTLIIKLVFFNFKDVSTLQTDKLFLVLSFSILIIFIGLSNTELENIQEGFSLIIKRLPFILLPFLFYGVKNLNRKPIFMGFCLGVIVGAVICLINVSLTQNVYGSIKQIYISNWYWSDIILEPIDKHPSYFSIYSLLSFFISLEMFINNFNKYSRVILTFFMLFFIAIILTLESRIVIISFPVILFFYIIIKTRKKFIALIVLALSISIGTVYFVYHPARFHNIRILKLSKDSNIRLNIYNQTLELIKEHPFIGVGSGDVSSELNKKYLENELFRWVGYNPHNQFLEEWLRNGILGFVSIIILFLILFKEAYKKGHSVFLVFLLTIIVFSMVESMLYRQQGITFFMFFSSLFYYSKENQNMKSLIIN